MSDAAAFVFEIDCEAEIEKIIKKLDTMHDKAPSILKNAINSTARKVRKQITKDAAERYAISNKSVLKKETEGAPKVYTARVGNLTATIRSRGPMQDIMTFVTKPNTSTGAAAAKILNSGGMKSLEMGGLKAFVTRFASGHTAIVQRRGAARLPVKKLLSPAVPMMLGNEEVRAKAEKLTYETLQAEIQKRIDQINDTSTW